jgi:uncharacterized protein
MDTTTLSATDLEAIARQLQLQPYQCQATVELLDEGNTVPFITRYRKDRTAGLDEEKIRQIQEAVELKRQLNDRRERILRSIQSQGALTPDLEQRIHSATSLKILEDLYLPYRPKKQTLATAARERGLEPLAMEILEGNPAADDLDARCQPFIDPEKNLPTATEVLAGAGHILAELLSERGDLRSLARRHLWAGKIASKRIEQESDEILAAEEQDSTGMDEAPAASTWEEGEGNAAAVADEAEGVPHENPSAADELPQEPSSASESPSDLAEVAPAVEDPTSSDGTPPEDPSMAESATVPPAELASPSVQEPAAADPESNMANPATEAASPPAAEAHQAGEASAESTSPNASVKPRGSLQPKGKVAARGPLASKAARLSLAEDRRRARREARHRKRQKLEQSFKDYFDYSEPLKRLPHYRVLAINRGERCKVLRVRIQFDYESLKQAAEQLVVPEGHRHAERLRDALYDALARLVVPSIEREIRRELTERAENHAVKVFAQNLRKLLLQPPLCGHRVLAIDPGFRSGCKLAVLDEFGNLLDHALIHVIGPADRVQQSMQRLADLIQQHRVGVIALGNGTACRETEQFVAEVLARHLADREVHYLIVNEAGASVYSTSQIGREELPSCDATVRGAVSIGRRALDPLSELVKIDPASIGVGLYQHDVKGKHLQNSLEAVVESCVNYVGVDVNSASPALLRAVSGLNQLTARRIYEFRQQHGPFRSREQLREVPGIGEATYVQAAGFLKIPEGDNPLDATWIHPESYAVAQRVLEEIGCDVTQFVRRRRRSAAAPAQASPAPSSDLVESVAPSPSLSSDPAHPPCESSAADPSVDAVVDVARETLPAEQEVSDPVAAEPTTPADDAPDTGAEVVEATESGDPGPIPTDVSSDSIAAVGSPIDETSAATPATAPETAPPVAASTCSSTEEASACSEEPVDAGVLERLNGIDVPALAERLSVGELLLNDILASLARPGRDPRDELPRPVFRREILKLEHLKPGMELCGTVLNVVDFGAFVDIGLSDSGLIHVSRLADRFVSDPHEVVSVGDVLNVWVVDVDEKRRRVSLTAIQPGSERPRPPKPERRPRREPASAPKKPRRERERERTGKVPAKTRRSSSGWHGKPKAKPVAPITEAMAEGREPMRTFSDLQQFFQRRQRKADGPKSKEPPSSETTDSD